MASPIEDVKTLRNWVLGVIGFASTVATFLIQVFHFRTEPTVAAVLGFSLLMLLVVFLINRTESRMTVMVKDHIEENNQIFNSFTERLDSIDNNLVEIQRSTLRIELSNEMKAHPENHDTILRMAERYFNKRKNGGLEGNWVMKDSFKNWVDSENKNGRPVNIPPDFIV